MILFENSLIKQDYDPHTDILSVDLPTLSIDDIRLVQQSLDAITESIRNYQIKKLLLDPSKTKIVVTPDRVVDALSKFYVDIMQTNLEKIARVRTIDFDREMKINAVLDQMQLTYQFENFNTKDEAMTWLTNPASLS